MNSQRKLSVAVGVAFLFQATTSLISGMIPMSLIVSGNVDQSMINIAGHAGLMRANFLGDLITAVGVIALTATLAIHCQVALIGTTLLSRRALTSRIGGWPKKRLYSRLNWLMLS